MADESRRHSLFVALDRATRGVLIRLFTARTAANARRFPRDTERACPIRIGTILTDSGKESTDRMFGLRKRAATGEQEFDLPCGALGTGHRLTPPGSPRTNGMVERFNGRIERGAARPSLPIRRGTRGDAAPPLYGSATGSSRNQPCPAGRPCRR